MSQAGFDLLVVGELNPDAILLAGSIEPEYGQVETLVDDGLLTVGSSGAITACGAARLGVATAYVGIVGDDAAGRFILDELRRRTIDVECCRVDPEMPTGISIVLSTGDDRAILTSLGAMGRLTSADVTDEILALAGHLHVSSPHLQAGLREGIPELFTRARAVGATTSLDPGWDPSGTWGADLEEALEATDVFLPNAAEACRFADVMEPAAALEKLAARVPTVVVKLGPEGAIARRGAEVVSAAPPAVDFVDATGAGDSFTAGFLHGIGTGESLEQSLRLATACGALSTRSLGGVDGQPSIVEALEAAAAVTSPALERSGA
jgi:sugar/nucleoside kinase (ribokinase family)